MAAEKKNQVFKGIIIPLKQFEYYIGIDTTDKNNLAYCLTMKHDENNSTIILARTMKDEKDFYEEVKNLSIYFNAGIIKER